MDRGPNGAAVMELVVPDGFGEERSSRPKQGIQISPRAALYRAGGRWRAFHHGVAIVVAATEGRAGLVDGDRVAVRLVEDAGFSETT